MLQAAERDGDGSPGPGTSAEGTASGTAHLGGPPPVWGIQGEGRAGQAKLGWGGSEPSRATVPGSLTEAPGQTSLAMISKRGAKCWPWGSCPIHHALGTVRPNMSQQCDAAAEKVNSILSRSSKYTTQRVHLYEMLTAE